MPFVRFVALPRPALTDALVNGTGTAAGWRALGHRILERAKAICPVGDGEGPHLRDALTVRFITGADPRIMIGATGDMGTRLGFVVDGTDPHPIDPVNASVLVFTVGGETVFARHVDHPGTSPNNFPRKAMSEVVREATAAA